MIKFASKEACDLLSYLPILDKRQHLLAQPSFHLLPQVGGNTFFVKAAQQTGYLVFNVEAPC
jgi:hypothetical protein